MSSWLSHNRRPAQNAVIVALSAELSHEAGPYRRLQRKRGTATATGLLDSRGSSGSARADSVDVPWQQFGDPVLHELVTSVLNQNLDLQAALERVKQAQA